MITYKNWHIKGNKCGIDILTRVKMTIFDTSTTFHDNNYCYYYYYYFRRVVTLFIFNDRVRVIIYFKTAITIRSTAITIRLTCAGISSNNIIIIINIQPFPTIPIPNPGVRSFVLCVARRIWNYEELNPGAV